MPIDPSTEREAQPRRAARVLVLDDDDHVLLFRGFDPTRPELGAWWHTPGGGVDAGESMRDAALRELREETGLVVDDVGAALFERRFVFDFEENRFDQTEQYFSVRTQRFVPADLDWSDLERRSFLEHRWWSVDELRATDETVYPEGLVDRLAEILRRD